MTRPLSRIRSSTSASPLGVGPPAYLFCETAKVLPPPAPRGGRRGGRSATPRRLWGGVLVRFLAGVVLVARLGRVGRLRLLLVVVLVVFVLGRLGLVFVLLGRLGLVVVLLGGLGLFFV